MSDTYQITKFGNSVLREPTQQLSDNAILSNDIQKLIKRMNQDLQKKEYGMGLSAPQINKSYALTVISLKPTPTLPDLEKLELTLINPKIIKTYGRKVNMWEGCISGGNVKDSICAKVPRPNKLRLQWLDEKAQKHDEIFEGFIAHTIQHEVDHLNGILFLDRVKDTKTYMLLSEFEKYKAEN